MSEYNIQMNKYNALNANYDQLYPKPMKHASTHAKDSSDPILPSSIGAYSKEETDTLLANKVEFTLLWENASPSSAFAAQTISIDLSAYEFVAVEVEGAGINLMRVGGSGINVGTHFGFELGRSRIFYAKTNGLQCEEGRQGYWNSGSVWSTSNTDAVPNRFYGIKI